MKQVQISCVAAPHDVEIKLNRIRRFLSDGFDVGLKILHRRRFSPNVDSSEKRLDSILSTLKDDAVVLSKRTVEGTHFEATLRPKKPAQVI